MDYESAFSHMPTMKGLAVEFPFCKIRYVKVQNDLPAGNTSYNKIASGEQVGRYSAGKAEKPKPEQVVIKYARPAEITTMGSDPMISRASVIHELCYGRTQIPDKMLYKEPDYPVFKEGIPHRLDIFV